MKESETSIWDLLNESDDTELDLTIIAPYMQKEFCDWLKRVRKITDPDYIQKYVNAYMSAYERLNDIVHVDVYAAFIVLFKNGKEQADFALDIFETAYIQSMEEMLQEDPHAFTQNEKRAMYAYRDFLDGMIEGHSYSNIQRMDIPYLEEFKSWYESLCKKYDLVNRAVSSLQRSIVWYKHTSLFNDSPNPFVVAARLSMKEQRARFFMLLDSEARNIMQQYPKEKTIQNCMTNIRHYFDFLDYHFS